MPSHSPANRGAEWLMPYVQRSELTIACKNLYLVPDATAMRFDVRALACKVLRPEPCQEHTQHSWRKR